MKILIVSLNFAPELTGIGRYNGEMADWFIGCGDHVRVVCAPPYYPAWRVADGYRGGAYRVERRGYLKVYRVPTYVPAHPSGARRLLHLLSFAVCSAPVILWHCAVWRPRWVFMTEPPLAAAPAVLLGAALARCRSWLHVQDFEVDAAFDLGLIRSARWRRVFLYLERWLLGKFDRVSTISQQMLRRLSAKGVTKDRSYWFPNWTDFNQIKPLSTESPYRRELGIPSDACVCLYSGTLGAKQGLEILLDALAYIDSSRNIVLVICGDGPARAALVARAKGDPRVIMLPLQPSERLNDLMALADIQLLPQRAEAQDLVMPSKLPSMLASARPVIASALKGSEIAEVLEGVGVLVAPGDAAALARAVCVLADEPDTRTALGRAGRDRAASLWNRERVLAGIRERL